MKKKKRACKKIKINSHGKSLHDPNFLIKKYENFIENLEDSA
jgi:hypothetical protein